MARQRATSVQQVIDAAARVFDRKGFVEATINDIAAEAGVSKPTIYQYASSKRWLLETIVEQVIFPLRKGIEEIISSDIPERQKLEQFLRLQVNSAITYRTYYVVLISDQHQLSPPALRNYLSWAREVNRVAAELLRQCAKVGVVRDDLDIGTTVNLIHGMLLSIARWYDSSGRIDPDRLYEQVIGLLSGYLLPPTNDDADKL